MGQDITMLLISEDWARGQTKYIRIYDVFSSIPGWNFMLRELVHKKNFKNLDKCQNGGRDNPQATWSKTKPN